ncbi:MAG: hypothetical protein WBF33_34845 [Candidatus Nitrosopolaris sp.]
MQIFRKAIEIGGRTAISEEPADEAKLKPIKKLKRGILKKHIICYVERHVKGLFQFSMVS